MKERRLRRQNDAPRHYPGDDHRIHERVGMVHRKHDRRVSRDAFESFDVDGAIEPAERNSRQGPKQSVDHAALRRRWILRSGTPRRTAIAATNINATTSTAAR